MRRTGLTFQAELRNHGDYVDILGFKRGFGGERTAVVKPLALTLEPMEFPDMHIEEGSLQLDGPAAQSLIDALWGCGMRPSGFKKIDDPEIIAAMSLHLADMRRITFKFLKMKDPP